MNPIAISLLLVASLVGFAYVMWHRLHPLLKAKPDASRFADIPGSIKNLLVYGFAQKRMLDDPIPGLLHIFIFVGFVVVGARTMTMIGMGFSESFRLPMMADDAPLGIGYLYVKDGINALILIGCAGNLYRRLFVKPQRLSLTLEGHLILLWISMLVISDLTDHLQTGQGVRGVLEVQSQFRPLRVFLVVADPLARHLGSEEQASPVGIPILEPVRHRMMGDPHRFASHHRHGVDVEIAFVVPGERDLPAIG